MNLIKVDTLQELMKDYPSQHESLFQVWLGYFIKEMKHHREFCGHIQLSDTGRKIEADKLLKKLNQPLINHKERCNRYEMKLKPYEFKYGDKINFLKVILKGDLVNRIYEVVYDGFHFKICFKESNLEPGFLEPIFTRIETEILVLKVTPPHVMEFLSHVWVPLLKEGLDSLKEQLLKIYFDNIYFGLHASLIPNFKLYLKVKEPDDGCPISTRLSPRSAEIFPRPDPRFSYVVKEKRDVVGDFYKELIENHKVEFQIYNPMYECNIPVVLVKDEFNINIKLKRVSIPLNLRVSNKEFKLSNDNIIIKLPYKRYEAVLIDFLTTKITYPIKKYRPDKLV